MRPTPHQLFERAAAKYAAQPNSAEAISAMMRLACEAQSTALRGWAAQWLKAKCNISVVTEAEQDQANATPATATGIL